MLKDLDEALRQLLVRELPVKVEITFDQPKREWSARIGHQHTLNFFLYDLRENSALRQAQPMWEITHNDDGTMTRLRKPYRMDLHYMVTAWSPHPEDEHSLLTSALMVLLRHPHLPEDLLPASLQDQPAPISLMVAQNDELRNPADIWSALDNEIRPTIVCLITLAVNPYQPIVIEEVVSTRETRFGQAPDPAAQALDEQAQDEAFWTVGGTVQSERQLQSGVVRLTLVERGLEVPIREDGRFSIDSIRAGNYTLEIAVEGGETHRHKITVPAPDYTFEV